MGRNPLGEKMANPEEKLQEVKDKLEPAVIKNRDEKLLKPKEWVIKQAITNKLFIVDDTLLDKPDVDFSHFDFMIGNIKPYAWEGCQTYMDILKVFWVELSPYLKRLVINYEVANNGIHAVEADMKYMLEKNANLIAFLKYEGRFELFKDFEKHQEEKKNSTGECIQCEVF